MLNWKLNKHNEPGILIHYVCVDHARDLVQIIERAYYYSTSGVPGSITGPVGFLFFLVACSKKKSENGACCLGTVPYRPYRML